MSARLDESHDPALRSWVESANRPNTDFPIQNLPFGVFTRRGVGQPPRIGVAIGDQILDVPLVAKSLRDLSVKTREALLLPELNALMAQGHDVMRALRGALAELLRDGSTNADPNWLVPMAAVEMHVPATIGDYTDFYASLHHATRVGQMFRPDNPLLPNYKYVPIAYHGRSSSIVPSGTAIRRPSGQTKSADETRPCHRSSRSLDFELEAGIFIGRGNELGQPIDLADAEDHVFGVCLLNDWSARDIQAWESQPLGPFLSKSFATTVSPWIVTLEALAPFRVQPPTRPPGDPLPLPYLDDSMGGADNGIDMTCEVYLQSAAMRTDGHEPVRVSRTSFRHMYWTPAQMVAHHTVNGCNLRPGDVIGSGTMSGPSSDALGCLLEMTRGTDPLLLPTGEARLFLHDGDEVTFLARCERSGFVGIGFGECRGQIVSTPGANRGTTHG